VSQVQKVLDEERFDLLHFHEPFVPFLSLVVLRPVEQREHRHVPCVRGLLAAMELGSKTLQGYAVDCTGRIAVSAAARHFVDRFFPGDYKVIPNGVDVGRFQRAVPLAPMQDGNAETSCSSGAWRTARGFRTFSRPSGSCARAVPRAGSWWSARGPGARGAPLT